MSHQVSINSTSNNRSDLFVELTKRYSLLSDWVSINSTSNNRSDIELIADGLSRLNQVSINSTSNNRSDVLNSDQIELEIQRRFH